MSSVEKIYYKKLQKLERGSEYLVENFILLLLGANPMNCKINFSPKISDGICNVTLHLTFKIHVREATKKGKKTSHIERAISKNPGQFQPLFEINFFSQLLRVCE